MWRKNATAREMPSNLRLKKAWGQKKVTGFNPTAGKNLSRRNSVEGIACSLRLPKIRTLTLTIFVPLFVSLSLGQSSLLLETLTGGNFGGKVVSPLFSRDQDQKRSHLYLSMQYQPSYSWGQDNKNGHAPIHKKMPFT